MNTPLLGNVHFCRNVLDSMIFSLYKVFPCLSLSDCLVYRFLPVLIATGYTNVRKSYSVGIYFCERQCLFVFPSVCLLVCLSLCLCKLYTLLRWHLGGYIAELKSDVNMIKIVMFFKRKLRELCSFDSINSIN